MIRRGDDVRATTVGGESGLEANTLCSLPRTTSVLTRRQHFWRGPIGQRGGRATRLRLGACKQFACQAEGLCPHGAHAARCGSAFRRDGGRGEWPARGGCAASREGGRCREHPRRRGAVPRGPSAVEGGWIGRDDDRHRVAGVGPFVLPATLLAGVWLGPVPELWGVHLRRGVPGASSRGRESGLFALGAS